MTAPNDLAHRAPARQQRLGWVPFAWLVYLSGYIFEPFVNNRRARAVGGDAARARGLSRSLFSE
ncbi:MAG TPA: hypothetical protein VF178_16535, partial [Gemmatimonadaceae bacterium]